MFDVISTELDVAKRIICGKIRVIGVGEGWYDCVDFSGCNIISWFIANIANFAVMFTHIIKRLLNRRRRNTIVITNIIDRRIILALLS
jgi:hypothetical protein